MRQTLEPRAQVRDLLLPLAVAIIANIVVLLIAAAYYVHEFGPRPQLTSHSYDAWMRDDEGTSAVVAAVGIVATPLILVASIVGMTFLMRRRRIGLLSYVGVIGALSVSDLLIEVLPDMSGSEVLVPSVMNSGTLGRWVLSGLVYVSLCIISALVTYPAARRGLWQGIAAAIGVGLVISGAYFYKIFVSPGS